jgi:hypothetical protein
MALEKKNVHDRLAKRKQLLIHDFLPELDSETRSHKNDDLMYWVHGDLLRRFISCEDTLDDVVRSSQCFLRNKQYLCKHGFGLHPSKAREGKMLTKTSYNSFITMLTNERMALEQEQSQMSNEFFSATDLEITNRSHLFCQQCVDSFRSDIRSRISFLDLASQLVQDFENDFSIPIEIDHAENEDDYKYVVSKQFISSFLRIMKNRMHVILTHSNMGIDLLDLKMFTFDDSPQNEGLDLRVNSSITCTFFYGFL